MNPTLLAIVAGLLLSAATGWTGYRHGLSVQKGEQGIAEARAASDAVAAYIAAQAARNAASAAHGATVAGINANLAAGLLELSHAPADPCDAVPAGPILDSVLLGTSGADASRRAAVPAGQP